MKNGSAFNQNLPHAFVSEKHIDVECVTHIHITMEIVIVTQGTLQMTISGKQYDITEGFGVLIPPFEPHMFHSQKANACHVLIFSNELVGYFFDFVKTHLPKRHIFAVSNASMALVEQILPHRLTTVDCISAQAVLAPLCYDIYQSCEFEERKGSFDSTAYRAMEYIDLHFADPITLKTVSRAIGIHPVTLSKMFSEQIGIGFCYYVQYIRCAHAARLMKMSSLNLSEIAYESGFGSIRTFNRSFLSIYKIPPSEYRKREPMAENTGEMK